MSVRRTMLTLYCITQFALRLYDTYDAKNAEKIDPFNVFLNNFVTRRSFKNVNPLLASFATWSIKMPLGFLKDG